MTDTPPPVKSPERPLSRPPARPPARPASRPPATRRPPSPTSGWVRTTTLGATPPGVRTSPDVPVASVQGTLALDPPPGRSAGPRADEATPELRLVVGHGRADDEHDGPRADVETWARRFAQAVVEVIGGDRPLPQLVRWTAPDVYADLDHRVRVLGRRSEAAGRRRTVRPQVRSVHVCRPNGHVAEVSVHVRHGLRSRAIAARLELERGRWLCTILQLG